MFFSCPSLRSSFSHLSLLRSTSLLPSRFLSTSSTPSFSASTSPVPDAASRPLSARSSRFARVGSSDLSHFVSLIGVDYVITDSSLLRDASRDWMNKFQGASSVLMRPDSTSQVAELLHHCHSKSLAVVPQGGNTSLVGGAVPLHDECILSLSRMNRILSFDKVSGIVTCEAGVILEHLNDWLDERGWCVPLDLGSKGSCTIGGNVSTNAGGLRVLRYGSLHGSVLGLQVVQADGCVMDLMSKLRKDNTGYDLKQLFIGAEGTLGVITQVSLQASRKPTSVQVSFLGLDSFENVLKTLGAAQLSLNEIVSAVEFLDRDSMELVLKHMPGSRDPLSECHPFYVLIETRGSNHIHDQEKLNAFLEDVVGLGQVEDGVIAQDDTQQKELWVLREHITDSLGKEGKVYKYDISIPVNSFYYMVEDMRQHLSSFPHARVVGYGHLGDSNLHLNIHNPTYDDALLASIEPWLFERVQQLKGSISAEHGLGQNKRQYIGYSRTPEAIKMMHDLKNMFDPKGILNPYKVLPDLPSAPIK